MMITPSGCSAEAITHDMIVDIALDGALNGAGTPSSEWPMHAAIYRACPDAQAIVHTHSEACTALACLNQPLPAFHYMVTAFGGDDVRCAPYVTFGTPELARTAVAALAGRTACLLANHGMIALAGSLDRAMSDAILLESLCRQYLLARAAGTPRLLTAGGAGRGARAIPQLFKVVTIVPFTSCEKKPPPRTPESGVAIQDTQHLLRVRAKPMPLLSTGMPGAPRRLV